MTTIDSSEHPAMRGLRKFPDGRIARGKKEWGEAGKQWTEKKARELKAKQTKDMELAHPTGLAQQKDPDGNISRRSNAKPWLD